MSYDIPDTMLRITLTRLTGYKIPRAFVSPFMRNALLSIDRIAAQEGGPTAPLGPDRKSIGEPHDGLYLHFNDVTFHHAQAGGGRTRWDEVRAVYQGVYDVIYAFGYEECQIDAWRMVDGRSQRFKVKLLLSGVFVNAHSVEGMVSSLKPNVTAEVHETPSDGTATS
ncbi:MAG: hypothetical protein LQ337_003078 [Flavoplaca oasis]|nr:MAG: hypothetical protein LQ337_003078 [Flavoplaca oasis]